MNESLKNIAGLFRNTRTRTIIIFTGAILVFGMVIGLVRLMNQGSGPPPTVSVKGAPGLQSIPGGFGGPAESPEYAQLQQQQNIQEAKTALRHGTSAVPTIISASGFGQGVDGATSPQPCCNPCTAGCQPGGGATGAGLPLAQSSSLKPGTLIYDKNGHVIGTVGPDGKVRDANGNVIGTVGPDGLVRDANGNVIGGAAAAAAGTPVYGPDGRLLGTVGPDGKVRDANGNVIGTVGPDGVVRDLNGNVIGKTGVPAGTPVYEPQGKQIGIVTADGKVNDATCKIIGTANSDGVVHDANGQVIGKTGDVTGNTWTPTGTPVYDPQGKLIGVVGADGNVSDMACKPLGKADATSGIVQDPTGNVIGKAGTIVAGTPVCSTQVGTIGTVGPDGKVRDANGNVIGKVGPDGVVRDATGRVLGKTCPTIQGTPVYDAQGHLIGIVGPDGKVRDASGKVIGTMGLDGVIRDAQGNVIGSTTPPGAVTTPPVLPQGAVPSAQATQLQASMQRQEALLSQQKAQQLQQQMQSAMTAQANLLQAAWVAPVQTYVAGNPPTASTAQQTAAAAAAAAAAAEPPVVKAGDIMFGVLTTSVNSDEPGPILAKIVQGKFKGGELIGSLTNQGETVMLTFNTLNMPGVPKSVSINAVAIDPNTARTSFSSYTNDHYLLRYGSLFASSFVQGYSTALSTSGTTVVNSGLATSSSTPNLSTGGKFMVALGNVGTQYSARMSNNFNTPPTVYVNSGVAMGILFLGDVPPLPQ